MDYTELMITVPRESVDDVTFELSEMGITSTQIIDNAVVDEIMDRKNDYEWDYIEPELADADRSKDPKICVYFEDTREGRSLMEQVRERFSGYETEGDTVHEQDWVNEYKKHFKVCRLTDSIVIRPSWEKEENVTAEFGPDKKILILDPGMAFGTGSHETTSLCAGFLEEYGCSGKKVMDVGTGSGILAMAASLLGAEKVLGIDIDPTACQVAEENVRINKCEDTVEIREGDLTEGVDFDADIICANLMADLVCMLSAHVKEHLRKDGIFFSSGILTEKKDTVASAIEDAGMKIIETREKGEWCAIAAVYA